MSKYIQSPINYTGNKYYLLEDLLKFINVDGKVVVDCFAGGFTFGINCMSAKKVIFIEYDEKICNLLRYLGTEKFEVLIRDINNLITYYGLSNSNKYGSEKYKSSRSAKNGLKELNEEGYYKMREDYNNLNNYKSKKANRLLYLLMVYGFNNDIRFNASGKFNIPCGKTDFNKNNFIKLKKFNKIFDEKKHEIVCCDVFSEQAKHIIQYSDVVYMDPPYLISNAVYNLRSGWDENSEEKLLSMINTYKKYTTIYLSNVVELDGKTNEILKEWISINNFKVNKLNKHYRSSSYNKKIRGDAVEVLVEIYENK